MIRTASRVAAVSAALGGALAGSLALAGPASAEMILEGYYDTAIGCDKAGRAAVASDDWTIGWECDRLSSDTWILYLEKGPSPK
ncbi:MULTISPECIES: hypothetical protein [Nocardiopsis]|uniref:hypothetical protein n=1 Tax=Nocardiopsis TaxID=2013 RepID=UPI000345B5C5|nr:MULTISPECIES: hypothetical protein [Nocardiopsis]